jgi:hypothetical protein
MERKQSALRMNPAQQAAERQVFYPMRGIIRGNPKYRDTANGKRTEVDVLLLDRTGMSGQDYEEKLLIGVPLCYQKMNKENGEEWTPENGDLVKVSFFNGNLRDPVIDGYLGPFEGTVMGSSSDPHPQSYRKRSGTSEHIDKDGNRTTIVKKHETVTVQTGDFTVTVIQGKCTVSIKGKTTWTSENTIDLIGIEDGVVKGCRQGDSICAYTGRPVPHVSATVKATP